MCDGGVLSAVRRVGVSLVKVALAAQVWLYRRTKGRRAGSMRRIPVLLLTTTGRRTGERRTRPVGYLPHGNRSAVRTAAPTFPRRGR